MANDHQIHKINTNFRYDGALLMRVDVVLTDRSTQSAEVRLHNPDMTRRAAATLAQRIAKLVEQTCK